MYINFNCYLIIHCKVTYLLVSRTFHRVLLVDADYTIPKNAINMILTFVQSR